MTRLPALKGLISGLPLTLLAATLIIAPVSVHLENGQLTIEPASAAAKESDGKDRSGKDDGKDDDGKDDGGKDDGGKDHGGNGGGDHSGPGGGGGGDDDNHSGGNSRDMFAGDNRPASLGDFIRALNNGSAIVSVTANGNDIQIVYSDGWKEQIASGVYEIVNPDGTAIVHRPANSNDVARLSSVL
ncbi:MAG: hypothetical protein H6873_12910 [Hyphomicrobiaceae bacterium]|nr:hypothetical protein [Hyphomicrobiaceae bacterium]